jgi:hypothetical protein
MSQTSGEKDRWRERGKEIERETSLFADDLPLCWSQSMVIFSLTLSLSSSLRLHFHLSLKICPPSLTHTHGSSVASVCRYVSLSIHIYPHCITSNLVLSHHISSHHIIYTSSHVGLLLILCRSPCSSHCSVFSTCQLNAFTCSALFDLPLSSCPLRRVFVIYVCFI